MWSHRHMFLLLLLDPNIMSLLLPLRIYSHHNIILLLLFLLFKLIQTFLILIEHGVLLQIWPAIESLRHVNLSLRNFRTTGQLIKSRRIYRLLKREGLTDGFLIGSFLLHVFDLTKVNAIRPQCFDLLHQCLLIIGATQYLLQVTLVLHRLQVLPLFQLFASQSWLDQVLLAERDIRFRLPPRCSHLHFLNIHRLHRLSAPFMRADSGHHILPPLLSQLLHRPFLSLQCLLKLEDLEVGAHGSLARVIGDVRVSSVAHMAVIAGYWLQRTYRINPPRKHPNLGLIFRLGPAWIAGQ